MGGLQIGKEHRHLGIGTTIGVAMRMVIALDIDINEGGGQVTIRNQEAESLPPYSYLTIPVPVREGKAESLSPEFHLAIRVPVRERGAERFLPELHLAIRVPVRERGAERFPPELHLAIPVPVRDLNLLYNFLPRWTDTLRSPMTLGLTSHLYQLPKFLRLVSSITPSLKAGMQCWSSFVFAKKIKKKRSDLIAWDCRRRK